MFKKSAIFNSAFGLLMLIRPINLHSQEVIKESILDEKLFHYHNIHLNAADNSILPWYSPDPGIAFDFAVNKVWDFWYTMRTDKNGLPYYMNHRYGGPISTTEEV